MELTITPDDLKAALQLWVDQTFTRPHTITDVTTHRDKHFNLVIEPKDADDVP